MNFKNKVIYQIWPRSFCDSNHDGIGDIQGIISKLTYLKSLHIDMIWLSPIYLSSNKDYGYDIDDYYAIQPEFGTMRDVEELIQKAKEFNIGIIMDLVANHTSDQHSWFKQALSNKDSAFRDYYIFKEGENGKEPNNWISIFGGSAWQKNPYCENEYYLATFTPNQCDLNWKNPKVREEVYKIMKFWLDKGIQGFRMDVINTIAKAEGLPDKNPHKKGYQFADELMVNRDESHVYLKEMHKEVLSKYDGVYIGEGMLVDQQACKQYSGEFSNELQMMFMFDVTLMGCGPLGKFDFRKLYYWNIPMLKNILNSWQVDSQINQYWLANFFSNHDNPRHISRIGNDTQYRKESAKAFAMLNFTLRGTPFLYQGEEIGMTNLKLEMEEWKDFESINVYHELQNMMHVPKFLAKKIVQKMTRDHARTPMQWNNDAFAGFSTVTPWIKLNPNYKSINVQMDEEQEDSILNFYRKIIFLRKNSDVLSYGDYMPCLENHKQIMAFYRVKEKEKLLILINLSKQVANYNLSENNAQLELLCSTNMSLKEKILQPFEGRIYKVKEEVF